jgi:hypothetical protein
MTGFYASTPNFVSITPTTPLTPAATPAELAEYLGLIADQSETPPNIAMLNGLLLAATQAVIDATGVQIVSRDFVCSYDYYPQTRPAFGGLAPLNSVPAPWLSFGVYPVTALASVTVGTDLLPPTDYEYDAARLGFATLVNGRIAIALTAGAATEWGKAAVLAVAAYMYEHRGGCDAGDAVKQSSAWALIKGQRRFAGGL